MSPEEFAANQEREIDEAKAAWKTAAQALRSAEKANLPPAEQRRLADDWVDKAREFFRILNDAVADPGPIRGKPFVKWKQDSIGTCVNVLHGLPAHQENIVNCRKRLGIPEDNYNFSPAVFCHMQALVAFERPQDAAKLREKFEAVGLPTYGFDHPKSCDEPDAPMNKQDHNVGKMILLGLIVLVMGAMGAGSVALGGYALYKGSEGKSQIDFLGFHVTTGLGAVALLAVGLILLFLTIREVLKKL